MIYQIRSYDDPILQEINEEVDDFEVSLMNLNKAVGTMKHESHIAGEVIERKSKRDHLMWLVENAIREAKNENLEKDSN